MMMYKNSSECDRKVFKDGEQSLSYGINLLRTLLLDRGHMERDRHFGIDPHDPRERMACSMWEFRTFF